MNNPYECYLLCPECKDVTKATGKEILCMTIDEITCDKCKNSFIASPCFGDGTKFSKVLLNDENKCLYIPSNIANYFHK